MESDSSSQPKPALPPEPSAHPHFRPARPEAEWVQTADGQHFQLAGLGSRLGARILDSIITWVATALAILIFRPTLGGVIGFVVAVMYEPFLTAKWGQTLGKRVVGIKVVRTNDGGLPGWGKSLGRWALPLGLGMVTLFVGTLLCYLSPVWNRKRQGWHDRAAGTLVVQAKPA